MISKNLLIANYFKPSIYVQSFRDVNISEFKRLGIKLFISDLDNTLVPHYTKLPNKEVLKFIAKVKDAGMDFVVVSNNIKSRVELFCKRAEIDEYYYSARKPFKKVFLKPIKNRNLHPSKVVFMGDQIILDILLANRIKCESILVQPLVSTDYKMSKFNIFLENKIYKNLEKNNILSKNSYKVASFLNSMELL